MAKKWAFVVHETPDACDRCLRVAVGLWSSLPVTAQQVQKLCPPCFEKE